MDRLLDFAKLAWDTITDDIIYIVIALATISILCCAFICCCYGCYHFCVTRRRAKRNKLRNESIAAMDMKRQHSSNKVKISQYSADNVDKLAEDNNETGDKNDSNKNKNKKHMSQGDDMKQKLVSSSNLLMTPTTEPQQIKYDSDVSRTNDNINIPEASENENENERTPDDRREQVSPAVKSIQQLDSEPPTPAVVASSGIEMTGMNPKSLNKDGNNENNDKNNNDNETVISMNSMSEKNGSKSSKNGSGDVIEKTSSIIDILQNNNNNNNNNNDENDKGKNEKSDSGNKIENKNVSGQTPDGIETAVTPRGGGSPTQTQTQTQTQGQEETTTSSSKIQSPSVNSNFRRATQQDILAFKQSVILQQQQKLLDSHKVVGTDSNTNSNTNTNSNINSRVKFNGANIKTTENNKNENYEKRQSTASVMSTTPSIGDAGVEFGQTDKTSGVNVNVNVNVNDNRLRGVSMSESVTLTTTFDRQIYGHAGSNYALGALGYSNTNLHGSNTSLKNAVSPPPNHIPNIPNIHNNNNNNNNNNKRNTQSNSIASQQQRYSTTITAPQNMHVGGHHVGAVSNAIAYKAYTQSGSNLKQSYPELPARESLKQTPTLPSQTSTQVPMVANLERMSQTYTQSNVPMGHSNVASGTLSTANLMQTVHSLYSGGNSPVTTSVNGYGLVSPSSKATGVVGVGVGVGVGAGARAGGSGSHTVEVATSAVNAGSGQQQHQQHQHHQQHQQQVPGQRTKMSNNGGSLEAVHIGSVMGNSTIDSTDIDKIAKNVSIDSHVSVNTNELIAANRTSNVSTVSNLSNAINMHNNTNNNNNNNNNSNNNFSRRFISPRTSIKTALPEHKELDPMSDLMPANSVTDWEKGTSNLSGASYGRDATPVNNFNASTMAMQSSLSVYNDSVLQNATNYQNFPSRENRLNTVTMQSVSLSENDDGLRRSPSMDHGQSDISRQASTRSQKRPSQKVELYVD